MRASAHNLLKLFANAVILYVPREENQYANDLAQQAFGYKEMTVKVTQEKSALITCTSPANSWKQMDYLQNASAGASFKLKQKALNHFLVGVELLKKSASGGHFKCLDKVESYRVTGEVLIYTHVYYWPTIMADCFKYVKGYEVWQLHGPIQRVPAEELHIVTKPLPLKVWAMDIPGKIHPVSSKRRNFNIVVTYYVTKRVEA